MQTASELRQYADERLFSGDHLAALAAYTALLRQSPSDLDVRLRVADSLLSLGEVQRAAVVYTALAKHTTHAGYPLRALTALKILSTLEPQLGVYIRQIAEVYAVGSKRLGRSVRVSPTEASLGLPEGFTLEPLDRQTWVAQAEELGKSIHLIQAVYPETLPPIPIFSELPEDAFEAMLGAMKLRRSRPGEEVIKEGEPGQAFFMIARGSVRIVRGIDDQQIELATLHEGSLFGEMALVSAAPRSATVASITDCDFLEFDRKALQAAASSVATIASALDKFTKERLLSNLMATSKLFSPLDRTQRLDLMRRFTAHDVAAGTDVIREGQAGQGLFVLMNGEVDVSKVDGEEKVLLATLKPGEIFGEISLIHDQPTTATVTAATHASVLFLSRDFFQKLVQAVPEIREYVETLTDERLMDTRILLSSDSFAVESNPLV